MADVTGCSGDTYMWRVDREGRQSDEFIEHVEMTKEAPCGEKRHVGRGVRENERQMIKSFAWIDRARRPSTVQKRVTEKDDVTIKVTGEPLTSCSH